MSNHHIATSEADYTHEESEILRAMAKHMQERGKPFLSNIETVRFLISLGFTRRKPILTTAEELPIVRHRQKKILVPRPEQGS